MALQSQTGQIVQETLPQKKTITEKDSSDRAPAEQARYRYIDTYLGSFGNSGLKWGNKRKIRQCFHPRDLKLEVISFLWLKKSSKKKKSNLIKQKIKDRMN
jgi:hypothetical protein